MKFVTALFALFITFAAAAQQTNVLWGYVGDYGLDPQTNVQVTLTLISPNPRTVGPFLIRQQSIATTSDTNGMFAFSNIMWGNYLYTLSGLQQTPYHMTVFTNTVGSKTIASLTLTAPVSQPNPATNYYTMPQVDAKLAAISAGGVINSLTTSNIYGAFDSGTNSLGFIDFFGTYRFPGTIIFNGQSIIETGGLINCSLGNAQLDEYGFAVGGVYVNPANYAPNTVTNLPFTPLTPSATTNVAAQAAQAATNNLPSAALHSASDFAPNTVTNLTTAQLAAIAASVGVTNLSAAQLATIAAAAGVTNLTAGQINTLANALTNGANATLSTLEIDGGGHYASFNGGSTAEFNSGSYASFSAGSSASFNGGFVNIKNNSWINFEDAFNNNIGSITNTGTNVTFSGSGSGLTNLNCGNLQGTLPVTTLPSWMATNALVYNGELIPTNMTQTPFPPYPGPPWPPVGYFLGDSIGAGYQSGGYSCYNYFENKNLSNYWAVGNTSQPYVFYLAGNSGYTLDALVKNAGYTPYPAIVQAMVADIMDGNSTTNFRTPDAYTFYLITNLVTKCMANNQPCVIFTADNWESGTVWSNNNYTRLTNLFTYYPAVTNLLNYVGTNAQGYVVTSNSATFQQSMTYLYNLNAAIVNWVADYANYYTNLGIVRLDTSPAVYGAASPDGWHPNRAMQIEFGKQLWETYYRHKNDFSPVPVPSGMTLVSNGFGPNTLTIANSATNLVGQIQPSQLPASVLTNAAAFQPASGNLTNLSTLNTNDLTGTLTAGSNVSVTITYQANGTKTVKVDGLTTAQLAAMIAPTTLTANGFAMQNGTNFSVGPNGNGGFGGTFTTNGYLTTTRIYGPSSQLLLAGSTTANTQFYLTSSAFYGTGNLPTLGSESAPNQNVISSWFQFIGTNVGPTWAALKTSNNVILWQSNNIPPTVWKSYFDANSNRVDSIAF